MSLQWNKASYGRHAYYADVHFGRYLVERKPREKVWRVKLNGHDVAGCGAYASFDDAKIDLERWWMENETV